MQHVFNEKDILKSLRDSEFFPYMNNTFTDTIAFTSRAQTSVRRIGPSASRGPLGQYLIFQMELIKGINLYKFQKQNLCLDINIIKYFSAQSLNIIDFL